MKLTTFYSVLLASASANTGDVCSNPNDSQCGLGECCGTATPDTGSTAASAIIICQTDSLNVYAAAADDTKTYSFACLTDIGADAASVDGSNAQISTVAAFITLVAFYMSWEFYSYYGLNDMKFYVIL